LQSPLSGKETSNRNYIEVINEKAAQDALERRLDCIEAEARRHIDQSRNTFSFPR